MQKLIIFFISISAVFIFNNCNNNMVPKDSTKTPTGGSEMLYASKWELVSLADVSAVSVGTKKPFLSFFPGKLSTVKGNTGCNNLTGSFELMENHTIKFSPLATTKMACMGDNVEQSFLNALSKSSVWSIANNELTLSSDGKILVTLAAVNVEKTEANIDQLLGRWELNYISGSRIAFDGLYPKEKPFMTFNLSTNEVGGNSTCNGFTCKINIKGNDITFGDPLKTMIFCEGGGENAFFQMLKKVNKYGVSADGNTLNLIMGDIAVMRFSKTEKN